MDLCITIVHIWDTLHTMIPGYGQGHKVSWFEIWEAETFVEEEPGQQFERWGGHSQPSSNKGPLPWRLHWLREETFSVFVSKSPQHISKTEVEAMFCRAGRVVDVFIPVDQSSRNNRGFAFVRFATKKDAENAVELALGRSWGGRKFHANLTQFQKKKQGRVNGYADLEARGKNQFLKEGEQRANLRSAGWILDEGKKKGVRVASWLIKQQNHNLFCSVVGFLKTEVEGLRKTENWIEKCWGKLPDTVCVRGLFG